MKSLFCVLIKKEETSIVALLIHSAGLDQQPWALRIWKEGTMEGHLFSSSPSVVSSEPGASCEEAPGGVC